MIVSTYFMLIVWVTASYPGIGIAITTVAKYSSYEDCSKAGKSWKLGMQSNGYDCVPVYVNN